MCVFALGEFPRAMFPPPIIESHIMDVEFDGRNIELALWDSVGQEEYERLRALAYHDSHVILICYAIDMPDSLENVVEKV